MTDKKILKLRGMSQPPKTMIPTVLVNATTLRPVKLPYRTRDFRKTPLTVVSYQAPRYTREGQPIPGGDGMNGYIVTNTGNRYYPSVANLRVLTEDEFEALHREPAASVALPRDGEDF